ncbi:putative phage associated protein [Neisseria meningitidis]|nr:putative phage associated protein [Neisseria meningitidis]
MKSWEDKSVAVGADMAAALADGNPAPTAEGCPPRLIGGEQNKTPNPKGAEKSETKTSNSNISAISYRMEKANSLKYR